MRRATLTAATLCFLGAGLGVASAQAPHHDDDPDEGSAPTATASASAPKPKVVRVAVPEKDGMLRIPGGTFTMGSSDKRAAEGERPAHKVMVPAFWIDRTEVTVEAYRACVDRKACKEPSKTSELCTYRTRERELPISCVPFESAAAFCRAAGKRLPREAEWELAARGTQSIRFPWGAPGSHCGYAATLRHDATGKTCTEGRPARVGSYPSGASPYGVLDLAGNVEEWTDDVFDGPPRVVSATLPVGLAPTHPGPNHVLRGGSWLLPPAFARTTARNWGSALEAGPGVGFRCAKDAAQ